MHTGAYFRLTTFSNLCPFHQSTTGHHQRLSNADIQTADLPQEHTAVVGCAHAKKKTTMAICIRPAGAPNPVWKDVKACSTLPSSALRRSVGLNENLGSLKRKPEGNSTYYLLESCWQEWHLGSCKCWVRKVLSKSDFHRNASKNEPEN